MLGDLPGKSFLLVQVACDLYLSTVTANLVDKGIIGKNLSYIWQTGARCSWFPPLTRASF